MKISQRSLSATIHLLAASAVTMSPSMLADTFGIGDNAFTLDFVTIGNPGNSPDTTHFSSYYGPYGAVSYTYQIGKFEVSRDMVTKANNLGALGISLEDMTPHGGNVGTHPATGIVWLEAAKFVNWLNTSSGYTPAYNFDSTGHFNLWQPGEAWQEGGQNLYRNKDAHYFLPSDNEWYKAAYFDGNKYFLYATGSETAPTAVASGTGAGTAVYELPFQNNQSPGPSDINNAGGLSPYGTMAQGGNVWEWQETALGGVNDSTTQSHVLRGGQWYHDTDALKSWYFVYDEPPYYEMQGGFRVAAVPEPEEYAEAFGSALIAAGIWLRRRKS